MKLTAGKKVSYQDAGEIDCSATSRNNRLQFSMQKNLSCSVFFSVVGFGTELVKFSELKKKLI